MVREFKIRDLHEVSKWYRTYGLNGAPFKYLPAIGYIVPEVAAGFIYRTDAYFAILENFVTNPEAPSELRHKAINDLYDCLISKAKSLGFEEVYAITNNESIEVRAREKGFINIGKYNVLSMEI